MLIEICQSPQHVGIENVFHKNLNQLKMCKLYLWTAVFAASFIVSCSGNTEHVESQTGESHEHGDEIVLHSEEAKEFGVKTIKVAPDTFYQVVNVTGQIEASAAGSATVSAPKAGTIRFVTGIVPGINVAASQAIASVSSSNIAGGDVSAAARARVNAAKTELNRVKGLLADGIVTRQQVNQAQAEYDQAVAAYSPGAASGAARSPIAGVLSELLVRTGDFVEAGQPIAVVNQSGRLTLRADVPSRYISAIKTIADGNIRVAGSENWTPLSSLDASLAGDAPAANSQGYIPLYFSISNDGSIMPGIFAEVALKGAPRGNVIAVPAQAVSEQQGKRFVYVKVDEDGYHKVPVETGATDGLKVEIISGIKAGDEVVSEGAAFVRLAESSGAVPEGHSHNH